MSATSTASSLSCSQSCRLPPSPSAFLLSSRKPLPTLTSAPCMDESWREETRVGNSHQTDMFVSWSGSFLTSEVNQLFYPVSCLFAPSLLNSGGTGVPNRSHSKENNSFIEWSPEIWPSSPVIIRYYIDQQPFKSLDSHFISLDYLFKKISHPGLSNEQYFLQLVWSHGWFCWLFLTVIRSTASLC